MLHQTILNKIIYYLEFKRVIIFTNIIGSFSINSLKLTEFDYRYSRYILLKDILPYSKIISECLLYVCNIIDDMLSHRVYFTRSPDERITLQQSPVSNGDRTNRLG